MPKEPELITCPNPECGRKIGELIVVSDVSTTPVKRFHACPHCFFELDVISAEFLRKEEMRLHAEEKKKRKKEKKEKRKINPDVDAENKEADREESAPSPFTHPSLEKVPDVISAKPQKEEKEKKEKEEPPVKPAEKKERGPSRCPHNFGYLASRPKNVPIPQECLTCHKVLDCVMKSIDNKTNPNALAKSH